MISGFCAPALAEVEEELARSFAERGELGAAVCVTVEGRTVVDLWGGVRDPATGTPWEEDTMVVVFSCAKGATALCVHLLAERGPAGKDDITVRMVLDHQAGLPGLSSPLRAGQVHDGPDVCRLLESEAPLWEPGPRHGYHPLTFGWLLDAVGGSPTRAGWPGCTRRWRSAGRTAVCAWSAATRSRRWSPWSPPACATR